MAIEVQKRPFKYCFSGNPVHYELYSVLAAADATVIIEVRIQFKNIGGAYTPSPALPHNPVDGIATIDMQDMLDGLLEYELPGFDDDEKIIWPAAKQTGEFYLQYREITEADADPDWDDSEKDYAAFVMKGGIGRWKYQGNNFWVNYFKLPDENALRPFFTWQPVPDEQSNNRKRLVAADERIFLLYLNLTNVPGIAAKAKAFYTDGSTKTVIAASLPDAGVMVINIPYYIPAGAAQWGLIDAGKTIHYWEITMIDEINPGKEFTETIRFYQDNRHVDNRVNYNDITLTYRGSLGGLDTARVRGVIERTQDGSFTEMAVYQKPDYYDGHYFTPQKLIANSKERIIYKGDIGYLEKEEQDRLREVHVKRETWWQVGRKWWPINITTKGNKMNTTEDYLFSVPLEFTHADDGDNNYTPMSVDLGDGVYTSNVCRATVTPLTAKRNILDGGWDLAAVENDPQDASEKYRYRVIKNSDGSVVIDWKEVYWNVLENFALPDDSGIYTIEGQAICANTIYGKKTTVQLDTATGGGGGGGGGGTGGTGGGGGSVGGGNNSIISNDTYFGGDFSLMIDGAVVTGGSLGANNTFVFAQDDAADVLLELDLSFTPTFVTVTSDGVTQIAKNIGGLWRVAHVTIVGGLEITIG